MSVAAVSDVMTVVVASVAFAVVVVAEYFEIVAL